MTEIDWANCNDPEAMLRYLSGAQADPRKLRLFCCACCRRVWRLLRHKDLRAAVEVAERFADGAAAAEELNAACQAATTAVRATRGPAELALAANLPRRTATPGDIDVVTVARDAAGAGAFFPDAPAVSWGAAHHMELTVQCGLLRDVFGNPFRPAPSVDPVWFAWKENIVTRIARAIYDQRAFDRLPVLADALQDAGCTDADLLNHCRGPGPHARGCWAIDLFLGREASTG